MKNIGILMLICLFALHVFAEGKSTLSTADKFAKAAHTFAGSSIPYRVFIPQGQDLHKKYPLVLALHGMGERGNDNNLQLTANKMATCWAEPTVQAKNPCYVIVPQCPITSGWADSPIKDVLLNLVDSNLHRYNIDPNRVYITGLSMGGNGTWNCISLRPNLFAAAVPIAGWGNTSKGPVIKNIPIWAFHGQADNVVTVDNSRFMVEAIINQGIEAIYTHCFYVDNRPMPFEKLNNELAAHSSLIYSELFAYGHNVWDYAYSNKTMFDWVFSKRKFIPEAVKLTSLLNDTIVHGPVSIKWNTPFENDSVEIWYKSEQLGYWKLLKKESAAKKAFNWDTDAEKECIYGRLRLCLLDSNSLVYSQTESPWMTIDQAGNGQPYVKLKTPDFYKANNIISKRIDVNYIANDVESDSLWVRFDYSANGGKSYSVIDSVKVEAGNDLKTKTILFSRLTKTDRGILKLVVFDEKRALGSDSTIAFSNQLGLEPLAVQLPLAENEFAVLQGYPNPASQSFTIALALPSAGQVNVALYNSLGQLIFQKEETFHKNTRQEIHLQTIQLPEGIYNYVVRFVPENKLLNYYKFNKLIIRH